MVNTQSEVFVNASAAVLEGVIFWRSENGVGPPAALEQHFKTFEDGFPPFTSVKSSKRVSHVSH